MSAKQTNEFRFRIDDESPDAYLESDAENLQVRRLGRRITWLAFLIPCLVGLLLAVGYFDLKERISGLDRSGGREIDDLSADFNARLAALSAAQETLAKSVTDRLDALKTRSDALASEVKAAQGAVQPAVERSVKAAEKTARELTAGKVDRQELDQAVGRLQMTIDPLDERVKAVSAEVRSLDQNLTGELASLSAALERLRDDMTVLKGRISAAPGGAVDGAYLDARLIKEQRIYQLKLDQTVRGVEQEMAGLGRRLGLLEARIR